MKEAMHKKKTEEKKGKQVALSYETYTEYKNSIMELFKRFKR